MLLEKSENLLEFSVRRLVIYTIKISKFDFPRSGYVWYVKNEM